MDKDDDKLELGEGRGEKITTQYSFFARRHRGGTAAGRPPLADGAPPCARRLLPDLTCDRADADRLTTAGDAA